MQIAPVTNQNANAAERSFELRNVRGWIPWTLAFFSGVLQVLIFPLPNWTFLCWVALAPLFAAALLAGNRYSGRPLRAAMHGFLVAWVSGITFYAGSCYWVYHVMFLYGGLSAPLAGGVLVLFCLYVGLVHGIFGALLAFMASRAGWGIRALLLAPFFWVAAELFRARVIAFPWDLLGTVLVDNIPMSRIATVTGVYGLSFEVALMNATFIGILLMNRKRRTLGLAAFIFMFGILETGSFLPAPESTSSGTARIVQQNLPLNLDWTPEFYEQTLADLKKLSIMQPGEGMPGDPLPDLVVWPESPAPFFENEPRYRQTLSDIARESRAYVLAGMLGTRHGTEPAQELFNSAELIDPSGEWIARYDKIHLVPFGEYVPLQNLLSFAKKLTKEVGNFVPGTERMVLPVHTYKLGIFICYESIFPDEVRLFARDGAGLLVNISNDGWFGNTAAPMQHLRMARMRAIENNRWVVRSTNTGVSGSIDPLGRVVKQLRRNVRVGLDVPYGVITSTTFYTRHGDWFAWTCAIISIGALFLRSPFRTGVST
ncbi:MAG TPA: apolipoprotein N-acyltransferase [Terriglobales bacterium]|nr:apolipoprotein N-acyltransferase [Terriglobales bacterium]